MTHIYYCALCWQEFDHPEDHNAGSWFGRQRLDKECTGDIRRADGRQIKAVNRATPSPKLDLDSSEPIRIA